jgi:2-(1,2-epoxy-1,2-dihydrophenyl)acetyl-CoA isomerase
MSEAPVTETSEVVTGAPVEGLRFELDGAVLVVTLDRPEVKNALAPSQRDALIELFEEASGSPDVRAVVLRASGDAFCSGADLRAPRPPSELQRALRRDAEGSGRVAGDVARMIRTGAQRLVSAVLDCEKPVVGAVGGVAAGIGAHLAFACDLLVASPEARFVEVFARRGIAPDGAGAWLLARLVGPMRAKELCFYGSELGAEEARVLGVVNRVVPRERLDEEALALARRLAEGPTRAIAAAKWLVNRALETDRRTFLEEEAMAQEVVSTTEDMAEGMRAFAERRPPRFVGR